MHVTLRLGRASGVWEFPFGGCWLVCLWSPEMHRGSEAGELVGRVCEQCREEEVEGWGAVCFCSWLPEKHPAHASAAALARQWQRCLTFRARGQGGASHHLPTKAQVTQPALALPYFLPSPHTSPHPTADPAEKTKAPPPQSLSFHGTVLSSLFEKAHYYFSLTTLQMFCSSLSSWFAFLFGQKCDSIGQ